MSTFQALITAAQLRSGASVVTGADALKASENAAKPRSFVDNTFVVGDKFAVPALTSEDWLSAKLTKDSEHPTTRALITVQRGGQNVPQELFLGTFFKSVRSRTDQSIHYAGIVDRNGAAINFANCGTQHDCWALLAGKQFEVTKVELIPVLKVNFKTGKQTEGNAIVCSFKEI